MAVLFPRALSIPCRAKIDLSPFLICDRYFVLLAMNVQGEIELFTLVFGGEGVNYVLLRTDGNDFHERAHEYVYAMGH